VPPSPHRVRQSWPPEAYALARQARSLNFLKIEPLIQKLQQAPDDPGGTALCSSTDARKSNPGGAPGATRRSIRCVIS
jgi:hypothetical protein